MKDKYTLIVGNIGTMFYRNYESAITHFNNYKGQSKNNIGRAAGEPVTLMEGDNIIKEYMGEPDYDMCPK